MSSASPFVLQNQDRYQQWREQKLANYPRSIDEICVQIADYRAISVAERQQITAIIQRCNMVIYQIDASNTDQNIPLVIAKQLGMQRIDTNFLSESQGVSVIMEKSTDSLSANYIPYTNKPINWHCDGYYNSSDRQINGMVLHCVQAAASGGANGLLDHEMLYLLLRDKNPQFIAALQQSDVMAIPPGHNDDGTARGERRGPIFSVSADGRLHCRYTARKRHIHWKDTPLIHQARQAIDDLLSDSPWLLYATLQAGMGLLCNNVLHCRTAFSDTQADSHRMLYRARFFDAIDVNSGSMH